MGGKSSSSTSSNSTTTNTTNEVTFTNVDNRVIGDDSIVGGNSTFNSAGDISGVNIINTDYGAIKQAGQIVSSSLDLAEVAVLGSQELAIESIYTIADFSGDVVGDVISYLSDVDETRAEETKEVIDTVSELATVVQTNGESLKNDMNKYVILGALALAGLAIWQWRKK